jgi:hypothetical protein
LPVGADEGTSVGDIVGWAEGIEDTVGFNEGASLGAVEMEGDAVLIKIKSHHVSIYCGDESINGNNRVIIYLKVLRMLYSELH